MGKFIPMRWEGDDQPLHFTRANASGLRMLLRLVYEHATTDAVRERLKSVNEYLDIIESKNDQDFKLLGLAALTLHGLDTQLLHQEYADKRGEILQFCDVVLEHAARVRELRDQLTNQPA